VPPGDVWQIDSITNSAAPLARGHKTRETQLSLEIARQLRIIASKRRVNY